MLLLRRFRLACDSFKDNRTGESIIIETISNWPRRSEVGDILQTVTNVKYSVRQ